MKEIYVSDLMSEHQQGKEVILSGWLSNRRHIGKVIFLDISDSTGTIQAVIEKGSIPNEIFNTAIHIPTESGIEVKGMLVKNNKNVIEIVISHFVVIGENILD